jgi:hypothetical protein
MRSEAQDPKEAFEAWLLDRVAQSVEAGEVSGELLTDLRTEMERARKRPQEEGHALAVQDLAERVGLPVDRIEEMLAAIESQPAVMQDLLLRSFGEAWLAGRREAQGLRRNLGTV